MVTGTGARPAFNVRPSSIPSAPLPCARLTVAWWCLNAPLRVATPLRHSCAHGVIAMPALSRPESTCSTSAVSASVVSRLTECRSEFLRFFRRRLSRPEDAEDAFQDFCLKVIRAAQTPDDGGRVDAWLHRILRNTLTDYYRRRAARQQTETAYEAEAPESVVQPGAERSDNPCRCVRDLVRTLRTDYAEVVRRADLEEEPREQIAADLGLTINNIGVRLHRARRALKEKVEEHCSTCCHGSFQNCDCGPVAHGVSRADRNAPGCNGAIAEASL